MENYSLSHKLSIPHALIAATALVNQIDLYTLKTFQTSYNKLSRYHDINRKNME